ncbi:MAG: NUDIX domain-containing protein [Nitrososphaerota archaeon]|nr:NUDIX domain-containing protein [Nitrososphaerota archaeon]
MTPPRRIVLGAGTVVHRDGRLLVVKRANDPHRGLWGFPGGRVEAGETPMDAALRETMEEVGLEVEIEGIFDVVTYLPDELGKGMWDQVVLVDYLAKPGGGRVRINDESTAFRWALPSELVRLDTTSQMKACAMKFADMKIR